MSNEFTITVASNTVLLDANRQGHVTYTVFNASGRPLDGRATLASDPPNQAHLNWIQVEGAVERLFTIGGAEQFTVRVTAPAGVGVGNYTFRLKMVDVANMDEGVTEGPTVTIAIPPAPAAPPPTRPPWLIPVIGGVAALVLLILALVLFSGGGEEVIMPDVVGLSEGQAETVLTAVGLSISRIREEASSSVSTGRVARTEPAAGETTSTDAGVTLFISTGAGSGSQITPPIRLTRFPIGTRVISP